MRNAAVLLVISALALGCAHGQSVVLDAKDEYDGAYLRLRAQQGGCPSGGISCCEGLKAKLDQSLQGDQMADAAVALDAIAISCPSLRGAAFTALGHHPKPIASGPEAGIVVVNYVLDIGSDDRIYWISEFVDGQIPSRTLLPAGPHRVDVEIHVMTTTELGKDHLFRIRSSKEVNVVAKDGATVTAVLKRLPGKSAQVPFALLMPDHWLGSKLKAAAEPPPPPRSEAELNKATIAGGERLDFGRPRFPSELKQATAVVMGMVCLDSAGTVESVSPLASPHPRYTAMLVAGMFQSKYRPRTINGRPVPSCHPVRLHVD